MRARSAAAKAACACVRMGLGAVRHARLSRLAVATRADRTSGSNLRPARLAVLEAGEPPHASTPLVDVATGPLKESVVIPAAAPFDQMLRAVATARPTHLVGYASVIGRLAPAAIAGVLKIRPVRVSTNSEPLSEEDRDAIEVAWGAPVDNL
jgi:hypothetical protein